MPRRNAVCMVLLVLVTQCLGSRVHISGMPNLNAGRAARQQSEAGLENRGEAAGPLHVQDEFLAKESMQAGGRATETMSQRIAHAFWKVPFRFAFLQKGSNIFANASKAVGVVPTGSIATTSAMSLPVQVIVIPALAFFGCLILVCVLQRMDARGGLADDHSCGAAGSSNAESNVAYPRRSTCTAPGLLERDGESVRLAGLLTQPVQQLPSDTPSGIMRKLQGGSFRSSLQSCFVGIMWEDNCAQQLPASLAWWKDEESYTSQQMPLHEILFANMTEIGTDKIQSKAAVVVEHREGSLKLVFESAAAAKAFRGNLDLIRKRLKTITTSCGEEEQNSVFFPSHGDGER